MNTAPQPKTIDRDDGIGSSDIAAILGKNKWRTPWKVWAEKRGVIPAFTGNLATELGHRFEPVLADWFAEETGARVFAVETVQRDDAPWAFASPDRLYVEDDGEEQLLEIKLVGARQASRWGEPWTDDIPDEYLLQWQWQSLVTGIPSGEIVACIGGTEMQRHPMAANPALQRHMFHAAEAWHALYLEGDDEPVIDGSDAARDALAARWNGTSGNVKLASAKGDALMRRLAHARALVAQSENLKRRLENEIKLEIGPDAGIECAAGVITWKFDKRKRRVMRCSFSEDT